MSFHSQGYWGTGQCLTYIQTIQLGDSKASINMTVEPLCPQQLDKPSSTQREQGFPLPTCPIHLAPSIPTLHPYPPHPLRGSPWAS